MSIAFRTGHSNARECTRGQAIQVLHVWSQVCVTSLERDLWHPFHTYFLAIKICDQVVLSFDIVIEPIDSNDRVDLLFEHYVITAQTLIDNYLVLLRVFAESNSGIPPPPPVDRSIPVVSSSFWTTGPILHHLRYEL